MKKTITVIITALFAVLSVACGKNSGSGASFSITSSNGKFTSSENVYTITSAGVYSLKGSLNGQIVVEAGDAVRTYSLSLHSAGDHTVMIDGKPYTFTNSSSYSRTRCYSDVSVSE